MTTKTDKVKPSCFSCPQLLMAPEQPATIGKSIGGPMCPTKLKVITRPHVDNKHAEVVAKSCDSYGQDRMPMRAEAITAKIELPVAFPSIPIGEPMEPARVVTCASCKNYVPPMVMRQASGWQAAFCKAKGNLILDDRLSVYAQGCEDRSFNPKGPLNEFDPAAARNLQINFLPEYMAGFGKPNPLAMHEVNLKTDPMDYATDKPVSPVAQAIGVRAWRRVEDPKGYGPAVFMPVFDFDKLPPAEQQIVPKTGDDERPEWYVDHQSLVYRTTVMWLRLGETPALWGMPGVGKTELFRHMAWLMCLPFERISITGSTELDDLAGKMMFTEGKGTWFHYGRLPRAWQKPSVICLDEPNTGPAEVWQFLRPLTDDSKQLVLDQNEGERIKAHAGCYLGMAMNPAWDARNVGAMTLGDADGNRLMHMYVELPPAPVEKSIIMRRLTADKWDEREANATVDTLMRIAPDLRKLSEDGVIPISWGIRPQVKVARSKRYMSWRDAFRAGVADSLDESAKEAILDAVQRHVPEE